jgi:hypothetical protein
MSKKTKKEVSEKRDSYNYKTLIIDIATAEYRELCEKVTDLTFEEAFRSLDGFDIEANPYMIGGELISVGLSFVVYYKHLRGHVFKDGDEVELGETWEFLVDGDEVARFETTCCGEVDFIGFIS